jgi:glycosyltransferase involved in cell wall biosynthesis
MLGSFRFGGSERHVLELVRRLDRDRFKPSVAVNELRGDLQPLFEATGVPIHVLGVRRLLGVSTPARFRELLAFARRQGVRIVHGFNFHGGLYGALLVRRRTELRLVTSERGIIRDLKPHQRWARRFYHHRSARMLVNSEEVKANVAKASPLRAGWLEVIPNGIDTSWFAPEAVAPADLATLGLRGEGPVVGHVGRFRREKGQMFLLEALKEVASRLPSARFLLVGGGPDAERVAAHVAAPPLAGRTVVLDYQEDVRPFLRAMDVFVLPSRSEGMPNALLEAMSMGAACVATRVGGTRILLDEGRAGRLLDFGDLATLVEAITGLVRDASERRRLALAARGRAVERFSMDRMMQSYYEVYDEALGEGPRVARA